MSWLKDIAQKTENLLNKLDDGAAAALNSSGNQRENKRQTIRVDGFKERTDHEVVHVVTDTAPSTARETVQNDSVLRFHSRQSSASSVPSLANLYTAQTGADAAVSQIDVQLSHDRIRLADMERQCRRLQQKEMDLLEALRTKDTQMAVLRVRLEEADEELKSRQDAISRLQRENEGLLKSSTESTGEPSAAVLCLQQRITQLEERVQEREGAVTSLRQEHDTQVCAIESSRDQLSSQLSAAQRQLLGHQSRLDQLTAEADKWRHTAQLVTDQLADYRSRAQRVLSDKDKLIASLRRQCSVTAATADTNSAVTAATADTNTAATADTNTAATAATADADTSVDAAANTAETTAAADADGEDGGGEWAGGAERQWFCVERDSLLAELARLSGQLESEQQLHRHAEADWRHQLQDSRQLCQQLHEQLDGERRVQLDTQQQLQLLQQKVRDLREDMVRDKASCETLLQEKTGELEKLKRRLAIKSVVSNSEVELENRLHTLSDNLIRKQTCIETLNTENRSLSVQLERCQRELCDIQQQQGQLGSSSSLLSSAAGPLLASGRHWSLPGAGATSWRSPLPTSVLGSRLWASLHHVTARLTALARRHPLFRNLIVVYLVAVHLWLCIVLYSYTPEVHTNMDDYELWRSKRHTV